MTLIYTLAIICFILVLAQVFALYNLTDIKRMFEQHEQSSNEVRNNDKSEVAEITTMLKNQDGKIESDLYHIKSEINEEISKIHEKIDALETKFETKTKTRTTRTRKSSK